MPDLYGIENRDFCFLSSRAQILLTSICRRQIAEPSLINLILVEPVMKKTIATMLYVSSLAFGVVANATENTYSPPVESHLATQDNEKHETKVRKKNQRIADRALSRKVRQALTKTQGLQTGSITVLARQGVVSLVGYVPDNQQVQLAGDSAGKVVGVTSVTNNLVLGEPGH
jgi:hypothetical protein